MKRHAFREMLWPAVIALAATAAAAGAEEDGGTRSVFAQGAGNRALGMGGAYAAVADDAVSTMWNAGGLGRITRFEVQASQTSFFDLGVNESYLAVVKPDWRWGAASLTLRHFGVGGLDVRDERNVVIREDASDSQTEVALGYGRPWGEAWTFGAAVKARRQNLAGLSANGFGVDAGVTARPGLLLPWRAPWLQNVTGGLALSNLVRPSMRLDRDDVGDPRAFRIGFAYTHAFGGMRKLLAALDVEKSADVAPRFHAGAELRAHPLLALRAGLRRGGLTMGTGVRWRDLTMDYAFEDSPLGGVQRLGLTYAFGPTVSESRLAAARAEEETIQARLEEAFQQRQAEQLAALLRQADELAAAGRSDEALEVLATASALEPERQDIRTRMAGHLRERAAAQEAAGDFAQALVTFGRALALDPGDRVAMEGQQRCQDASDERAQRSAGLRKQFETAMNAFAAEDFIRARRAFQDILSVEPDDADARAMLQRTRQALERRAASLLDQAGVATRRGELVEAAELIAQARALDPDAARLGSVESALARARDRRARAAAEPAATPRAPAPAAPAPLSAKRQRELEAMYRRGLEAMRAQRSDDALRYWELVWSESRDFEHVADYLKREYLTRGMESFAAGRLQEAVSFWERALQVDPEDQRARGYLARALKQLERTREILGADP